MYISQKLRLGKYLGANIVLWGIIMMLHSVPETFGPFFVLRLLLGKPSNTSYQHFLIAHVKLSGVRNARELCRADTHPNYLHVLHEEGASECFHSAIK